MKARTTNQAKQFLSRERREGLGRKGMAQVTAGSECEAKSRTDKEAEDDVSMWNDMTKVEGREDSN